MLLKVGDKVQMISGKDKGKTGTVKKTISTDNKIIVEGINLVKKHQKSQGENSQGGIIDVEAPVNASNAMIVDPLTGKPVRIGYKVKDDKKIRVAKQSGNDIDK